MISYGLGRRNEYGPRNQCVFFAKGRPYWKAHSGERDFHKEYYSGGRLFSKTMGPESPMVRRV